MAVPTLSEIGLDSYFFSDMKLSEDETLTASLRMFIDLDLINRFHINYEVIITKYQHPSIGGISFC